MVIHTFQPLYGYNEIISILIQHGDRWTRRNYYATNAVWTEPNFGRTESICKGKVQQVVENAPS